MKTAPEEGAAESPRQDSPHDSTEYNLFDYAASMAEAAADEGMARAVVGDLEGWVEEAYAWICSLEADTEFDAADLRASCSAVTSPALVGAVFRRAAAARIIEAVDVVRSRAVSRHGSLVRRWRVIP